MNKWFLFFVLIIGVSKAYPNDIFTRDDKGTYAPLHFNNLSLETILKAWAETSGRIIIWEKGERDLKDQVVFQSYKQSNKEDIESKIISLLGESDLYPILVNNVWIITPMRDVRYLPVPEYEQGNIVPAGQMRRAYITLKFPIGDLVARSFRTFVSRYGRILTFPGNKGLIIMDFSESIEKMMYLAKTLDTAENYEQWLVHKKERFFEDKKEELAKSQNPNESEKSSTSEQSSSGSSTQIEKNISVIKSDGRSKFLELMGDNVVLKQNEINVSQLFQNYFGLKGIGYQLRDSKRKEDEKFVWNGPLMIGQVEFFSILGRLAERVGLTITLNEQDNVYGLEEGRDLRYKMQHSYENIADLPKENRIANFIYRPIHVSSKALASLARPLSTRYGRISTIEGVPFIMIQDYSDQIREIVSIFQRIDNSEINETIMEEEKKLQQWEEDFISQQTVNPSKFFDGISDLLAITICVMIILIGGIIGFGMRGYIIRKWEWGP